MKAKSTTKENTISVKLRKRKNANGTVSLRLDIFHDGKRWVETLKELQLIKFANLVDRKTNKENFTLAEKIAVTRAHQLQSTDYSMVSEAGKKTIVAL